MNPKILVLSGKQRSGKTILARELARQRGKFTIADVHSLTEPQQVRMVTAGVDAIIIEDVDFRRKYSGPLIANLLALDKCYVIVTTYERDLDYMKGLTIVVMSEAHL